ncbi:hypothetical protein SAMN05877838_3480 [Hoeflea halophila]|uniref:Uncharacterized protein n=1 Tax=Hoeflea halophila TaxID=714899 RepID=A0A286IEQ1_9HYPH|nr:hypothetical protein SAMN05877838_3480 [Hoeflea halophila]
MRPAPAGPSVRASNPMKEMRNPQEGIGVNLCNSNVAEKAGYSLSR